MGVPSGDTSSGFSDLAFIIMLQRCARFLWHRPGTREGCSDSSGTGLRDGRCRSRIDPRLLERSDTRIVAFQPPGSAPGSVGSGVPSTTRSFHLSAVHVAGVSVRLTLVVVLVKFSLPL